MSRTLAALSMFVVAVAVAWAHPRGALAAPPAPAPAPAPAPGPSAAPANPDAARAAELKKRGDDAMDTGRPADAVIAYAQAYELTKDPVFLYNQGRALQATGRYPEALAQLETFDATAPPELKARVPGLGDLLAEVRGRVSTLAVTCAVAGAQIRLNDTKVGTTPLAVPLKVNAGHAVLELTAEGYRPFRRELDLPGG